MGIKIKSISYALPEQRLTHTQLCDRFGKDVMDKVAMVSGIYERRIATENECASDFALTATKEILKGEDISTIDMLIFATQTPDYLLPTTACILQHKLGLKKDIIAFDINLGCTQFIYALSTAYAYINAGMAKKALILSGDTPTRLINAKDKSAVTLFSDAGSACIVEYSQKDEIVNFVFGSDGAGYRDLICETSGMRHRPKPEDFIEFEDENQNVRSNVNLYINGFKIFAFAFKTIPQTVTSLLQQSNLSKEDIDLYIFHQAGEKIVSASAQRLGLPLEKVFFNLHDIGNCGGSSVAIALVDAIKAGKLKAGMKVMLCTFGVGLSWGGCIIDFNELPKVTNF
ncbi:MAG: ketoacyl-ACP synthase III [Opitutales bacterium]|nr:ketoacyl-ACP synthase III [Opitutales bacterium]